MINLYNNNSDIKVNQYIYDSYNHFIFSEDRNIFNKLYSRFYFYNQTKDLLGDIVECGVFKGSGIFSWLKILDMNEPNSIKKVIGFDFFGKEFVDELSDDVDRDTMREVFERCDNLKNDDISLSGIISKIEKSGFNPSKYELIQGDVSKTTKKIIKERPGLRISILYMDLDIDEPTYDALNNLWDFVVPGGIVVFDEYAYHRWTESNAVDRFINERGIKLYSTHVKAPTAYIVK